jgi:hypothetical protein
MNTPVKSEATPRPWKIDDRNGLGDVVRVHESPMRHVICYTYGPPEERQADAALIVECVNSNSALLAQNAELVRALELVIRHHEPGGPAYSTVVQAARAALAGVTK